MRRGERSILVVTRPLQQSAIVGGDDAGDVVDAGNGTNLGSVGPESRFLIVELNGLVVELDGLGPVVGGEGLVALVLEGDGLFLGCRHCLCCMWTMCGCPGCVSR